VLAGAHRELAEITSPSQVPVPLCKRPAEHAESLRNLLNWHSEVLRRIEAVGDTFEGADGGPGAALLRVRVVGARAGERRRPFNAARFPP
jgi:hypothetical protein